MLPATLGSPAPAPGRPGAQALVGPRGCASGGCLADEPGPRTPLQQG
jgi:hypothetical protein